LPFEEKKQRKSKIMNKRRRKKHAKSSESINGWMIPEGEKEQLFMSLKQSSS